MLHRHSIGVLTALLGALAFVGVTWQPPAQAISAVPWMNNGAFQPVPGLGDLSNGLYNDFRKGSLVSERGPAFSLTRATVTTSVDSSDLVVNISSGAPRWHRIGASSGVTGLAVWGAHTNIALQSEDFGTTWAAIAATSPTRSAAAASVGVVVLDLLGDDSAILAEGYTQTISFTGNAVKSVSLYYKCGTAATSLIRLRDTSAPANRLLTVITCTGGVPASTETTGTEESGSPDVLAGGVYRFRYATTSVTAANTNVLEIYPASDGVLDVTAQGNANFGGVMVQNATQVFPYVKTTTASVTVNADAVTAAGSAVINPTEGTLYSRATTNGAGNNRALSMNDGTGNERFDLVLVTGNTARFETNAGGVQQASIDKAVTPTSPVRQAARYRLNDFAATAEGAAAGTDTGGTVAVVTTFEAGALLGANHLNGVLQVLAYSRTGASDANLAIATAP